MAKRQKIKAKAQDSDKKNGKASRNVSNEMDLLAIIVKENPGLEKRIMMLGEQAKDRLEMRRRDRQKVLSRLAD